MKRGYYKRFQRKLIVDITTLVDIAELKLALGFLVKLLSSYLYLIALKK